MHLILNVINHLKEKKGFFVNLQFKTEQSWILKVLKCLFFFDLTSVNLFSDQTDTDRFWYCTGEKRAKTSKLYFVFHNATSKPVSIRLVIDLFMDVASPLQISSFILTLHRVKTIVDWGLIKQPATVGFMMSELIYLVRACLPFLLAKYSAYVCGVTRREPLPCMSCMLVLSQFSVSACLRHKGCLVYLENRQAKCLMRSVRFWVRIFLAFTQMLCLFFHCQCKQKREKI